VRYQDPDLLYTSIHRAAELRTTLTSAAKYAQSLRLCLPTAYERGLMALRVIAVLIGAAALGRSEQRR
jgi:hypothetical protein